MNVVYDGNSVCRMWLADMSVEQLDISSLTHSPDANIIDQTMRPSANLSARELRPASLSTDSDPSVPRPSVPGYLFDSWSPDRAFEADNIKRDAARNLTPDSRTTRFNSTRSDAIFDYAEGHPTLSDSIRPTPRQ